MLGKRAFLLLIAVVTLVTLANAGDAFAGGTRHIPRQQVKVRQVMDSGPGPGEIGLRYDTPTTPSAIAQDQAIQAAIDRIGPLLAGQAKAIVASYVLFTDEQNTTVDAVGQQHAIFQQVPAWVVTFFGVNLLSRGGDPKAINHEVNVVVDARTGAYLELFSYR